MTRWPAETPAERATWGLPPPTAETCPEATERRPRGAFFVAANRLRDPRPLWLFRIPNPESPLPNPQSPPSNDQHHAPRRQPPRVRQPQIGRTSCRDRVCTYV